MTYIELRAKLAAIPTETLIRNANNLVAQSERTRDTIFENPNAPISEDGLESTLQELCRRVWHFEKRCHAAEAVIAATPCGPDITKEQIDARRIWEQSKS